MKIVYLSHNFFPEIGAPSARVLEMSKEWVKQGHEVTVLTGFPNYPTGIIPQEYRHHILMTEEIEGIRVLRSWIFATPNEGFLKRTLNHISLVFSSLFFSLPRLGKCDVVIATSPPLLTAFAGLIISWLKRVPFVFEVRDLWPAAIAELGVIKSKWILKVLESWELFLYRRASKVVVVTEQFRQNLIERGIPDSKIAVIYNGVALDRFETIDSQLVKKSYGLEGRFIILYSGAHGMSQGLETFLYVAEKFRNDPEVLFLFIGEGAMKSSLQEQAANMELDNIRFWPGQPREKMPEIYALADLCLVPLRKVALFSKFIPSKIFEIMASKKSILASLDGEAATILNSSGSAIVVPPEEQDVITISIKSLKKDITARERMGENGYRFVKKYFNRSSLAEQYLNVLTSIGHTAQGTTIGKEKSVGI